MEPPLVLTQDLEYRVGYVFEGTALTQAESFLDDASALVRDEAGLTWIDPITGEVTGVPASIRTIVLRMAERVIRNPEGYKQESAGDYSYAFANSEVYLTDAERRIIRRAIGRTGLWNQPVERGDSDIWNRYTLYCEDNYGQELFPLTDSQD